MRICLYSPYVPEHTGGGEKYFFDVARLLTERHQVQIALPAQKVPSDPAAARTYFSELRQKYETFLNVSLAAVEFIASPLGTTASFWRKLIWTAQFDVMYYATDGSLFLSLARKNIVHIQIPFHEPKSSFIERLKLANWSIKNTNSEFTKAVIEKNWHTKISVVHQPMVAVPKLPHRPKEKIILNVGRFFKHLHSKRQDVLVELFKRLHTRHAQELKNWKLVLIGGVEDQEYATEISRLADGLPIEIRHQVDRDELWQWYARASIYWHATGFEVNEEQHPEKVEHFGISTVEAMAAGCVPVVVGKGGQKEILGPGLQAGLWQTLAEGSSKTLAVIENEKYRVSLSKLAQQRAALFSEAVFEKKLWQMVEGRV